jgi:hypothetical protein
MHASSERPGYDAMLAHALCRLIIVAEARAARTLIDVPVPYLPVADLEGASIFVSPRSVAVVVPDAAIEPPANVYDAFRDALRWKLAEIQRPLVPLHLAGHGFGGAVAALAALDLDIDPDPALPRVAALYTFGASPVGEPSFMDAFDARLGAMTFALARPRDDYPNQILGRALPLRQTIEIRGGTDDDDAHALQAYCDLLDPLGGVDWPALDEAIAAGADAHVQEVLATHRLPWTDVRKCLLDSAEVGGRIVLSWDRRQSHVRAVRYDEDRVHIAVQRIIVRAGHSLLIESPHGQEVHLVVSELMLAPGAIVEIRAPLLMHAGVLRALPPLAGAREVALPSFEIRGPNGAAGFSGACGSRGVDGGAGQAGTNGGEGAEGGVGQAGGTALTATISAGELHGRFVVHNEGGCGGDGGDGGRGGAGGKGGSDQAGNLFSGGDGGRGATGGRGGNGGDGSTVYISFQRWIDAEIVAETPPAGGGKGGAGGAGAAGGRGHPPGAHGEMAPSGAPGAPGRPGRVEIHRRIPKERNSP